MKQRASFNKIVNQLLFFFAITIALGNAIAQSQKYEYPKVQRIALLIGNSDYSKEFGRPLVSPFNDVDDLACELTALGFKLIVPPLKNGTREQMLNAIHKFRLSIYEGNKFALFYYSGHGFSSKDGVKEYIVPSDVANQSEVEKSSISITEIHNLVRPQNGYTALVLDSCRDNIPESTPKSMLRYTNQRELSFSTPNMVTLYAASYGQEAFEKYQGLQYRNSLFTHFFLNQIRNDPTQTIIEIFDKVKSDVSLITNNVVLPAIAMDNEESPPNFPFSIYRPYNTNCKRNFPLKKPIIANRITYTVCDAMDSKCKNRNEPAAPNPIHN